MPFQMVPYGVAVLLVVLFSVGFFLVFRKETLGAVLSWRMFAAVVAVVNVTVVPLTMTVGTAWAKDDRANYQEFWSGLEADAWAETVECEKDGSCRWEYRCDPYQEYVPHTVTVPDGKGGMTTRTQWRYETRWRDCPYVQREVSYYAKDTLGNTYSYGENLFPPNPEQHRWRGDGSENRSLPNVQSAVPNEWQAVQDRVKSGNPGGVTVMKEYNNYILALQKSVYRKYSDSVPQYLDAGLLPTLADSIIKPYSAHKAYFAGLTVPADADAWQFELQRFNGHFGGGKQGDLHVVFVDGTKVSDPGDYVNALQAYWQDSAALGKHTLSKNGVVLVVGVNSDRRVGWVDAFTGMPEGNEALVEKLRTFPMNSPLVASEWFAKDGFLWDVLMSNPGFQRVEMANYEHLKNRIVPSTSFTVGMVFFSVLFGVGAVVAASVGFSRRANS